MVLPGDDGHCEEGSIVGYVQLLLLDHLLQIDELHQQDVDFSAAELVLEVDHKQAIVDFGQVQPVNLGEGSV